ncbi:MAG: HupE/UreJ family protein [Patescibacteria group bacterium]|jgi:urease accessory protein
MKYQRFVLMLVGVFLLSLPTVADAHIIGGNGFASGIGHPFLGLDHLLAMVAVGIISVRIGGRAIWKIPAVFIGCMSVGAVIAIAGMRMPMAEMGIGLSVIILGIAIALSKKLPMGWAIACVALFAIFHGHAHGEEFPVIASPFLYGIGFIASTFVLHVTGIGIALGARKSVRAMTLVKYAGVGMSVAGVLFLLK